MSNRRSLHISLSEDLFEEYKLMCDSINMTRSAVGKILIESYVKGEVVIRKPIASATNKHNEGWV